MLGISDQGRPPRNSSRPDFERIHDALLHELDLDFFEDRFLTASPAEQRLLITIAGIGSRVSVRELRSRAGPKGNLDELLRRLIDRGLLYPPPAVATSPPCPSSARTFGAPGEQVREGSADHTSRSLHGD